MRNDNLPLYFDYAATTPIDPQVADSMIEYIRTDKYYGNPSSTSHPYGKIAKKAIEEARKQVAALLNAEPEETVWTSGATESINLALKGVSHCYKKFGKHIITVATEHKAVLEVCRRLETNGYTISYLPCSREGTIDLSLLKDTIKKDTILISIMHVNNETGVIQNIHEISAIARHHNIIFHLDAAQSIGKLPIDVKNLKIDLVSFSAHKIYGPKGVGALYVRSSPKIFLDAEMNGGGQENGLRSGTLATHQIIGMGKAFEIAKQRIHHDYEHCRQLQHEMLTSLSKFKEIQLNTPIKHSVPNIINFSVDGIKNIILLNKLREVAASAGSACVSGAGTNSHVLEAMQLSSDRIATAIRLSWGRFTTITQIKDCVLLLKNALTAIKNQ